MSVSVTVTDGDKAAAPGPSNETSFSPAYVPVTNTAALLGPRGETYEEEFNKLKRHLVDSKDLLGPSAPVIYANITRTLYRHAREIVSDTTLAPYNKCVFLFQIFDAIVLAYKNLSFVYCDGDGVRSVYGYSELALKSLLARVEAIARQVAVGVHDAYSLTVLNRVVASAEQRLSQVQTEQDMLEFFRGVSGGTGTDSVPTDAISLAADARPPNGVERYDDPFPEASTLLRRLYETNSNKDYVRDFYDAMFLIATSNAPATLSSALETRLADKDRNIVLFEAAGDRMFASTMCASAIAVLRRHLTDKTAGATGGEIESYRINYGRIFSKYRGESERNFDGLMEWIKKKVRGGDKLRVFWFPDIENLMSPRTSNDPEHIATIKNSMLQHMDAFNKDRTLRSFLLLFNSSEGSLDSAFSRRLETVVKTPPDPMTDVSVAKEVVGADLARYHINVTDELAARVAAEAGTFNRQSSRVGGFAHVQAALREMYVNQKLMLRHETRAIAAYRLPEDVVRRYSSATSRDTIYDLRERPLQLEHVETVAFSPASKLAKRFNEEEFRSFRYNGEIRGDPKGVDERAAARTIFIHDV